MENTKELQIIYVEDVISDAVRVEHALRKQNIRFQLHRVDTREDFLNAISLHPPDVILSDHGLPSFDGFTALALTRELCPHTPFIFVTSAFTPDMDLEKLVGEVADYISKSHLELLGAAVLRAWKRAETNRTPSLNPQERALLIRRLLVLLADTETNQSMLTMCASCRKIRNPEGQWLASDLFFRDYLRLYFSHGLCDECLPKYFD
jgi:CheY-like chemotaxis protein